MTTQKLFKPLILALLTLIFFYKGIGQGNNAKQLEGVIKDWYTSASNGQIKQFSDLLTDDFQLMAFGTRFDKTQILEMIKDYSDITYSLSNIRRLR
jgi:hypothetical protein